MLNLIHWRLPVDCLFLAPGLTCKSFASALCSPWLSCLCQEAAQADKLHAPQTNPGPSLVIL